MKNILLLLASILTVQANAKLKVACTTQDMEAVVKAIGGNDIETFAVAKGTQDPHQIEAKPSFMVKFRDADLIVLQGLELESAWLEPLIQGSRNPKIAQGGKGYLELGPSLTPIEVAGDNVSRAQGDVHPLGNPHFQLDPVRLQKAGSLVADRLAELDPSQKDSYKANSEAYTKRMDENLKKWKARIEKTGIKEFVSYHKSFSYFADRFGLKNTLHLEPKPGIPPTASHIIDVLSQMKARNIRLVLIENFFDDSVRGKIKKEIPKAYVVKVPAYVGGEDGLTTNEQLIEKVVSAFEAASK